MYSIFKKRPRRPAFSQRRPLLMEQPRWEQSGLPPKMQPCENGRHGSRDQVIDDADATVTSEAKLMLGRLESLHWTRQRPQ